MRSHLLMSVFAAGGFALLMVACGTRVIQPGERPGPGEGIAFMRVSIEGQPQAYVHVFTKGDRLGPHKARIDAIRGDDVYAFIIGQGEYDVGQISAGFATDIWPKATACPPSRQPRARTTMRAL